MGQRLPRYRLCLALAVFMGTLTTLWLGIPTVLAAMGHTLAIDTNPKLRALWGSSMLIGYGVTILFFARGSSAESRKTPRGDTGTTTTVVSSRSSCDGDGVVPVEEGASHLGFYYQLGKRSSTELAEIPSTLSALLKILS